MFRVNRQLDGKNSIRILFSRLRAGSNPINLALIDDAAAISSDKCKSVQRIRCGPFEIHPSFLKASEVT
jgi:hypothetical protein